MHLSYNSKRSGFYSGKGKGKRVESDEQQSVKSDEQQSVKSKSSSDVDSEYDLQLKKAKALSLQKDKMGESAKNPENSAQKDDFDVISYYTQSWKTLKDLFRSKAREHNDLKAKLDLLTTKDKSDLDKLKNNLSEIDILKAEIAYIEQMLLPYGVDPSEQFHYGSKPNTDSDSSYNSGISDKDSYSDNSEVRPNKRRKFSDFNNKDMTLVLPIYNILGHFTFILRFLSVIASTVLLLLIHLNLFPDFILIFNISLAEFLSLYFIVNFMKLMYKMYNTLIAVYNSYLNKDYMIIYTNLLFSIIIILLSFASNNDVSIFYI